MCGIIAIKGKDAVNGVYKGLNKLEYRGYDSCGIATKNTGNINVFKTVGYIECLKKTGVLDEIDSHIAIGHTRWATHGGVTVENSHPHTNESRDFAVVHNGILENYKELKEDLLTGYKFVSETDTEVIPHLIEFYYKGSVWQAFKDAISVLTGSYAIVMISKYDNVIYFARKSSPLILSQNADKVSLCSDINGFENKTNVCYIGDDTIGYYDGEFHVFNSDYKELNLEWKNASDVGRGSDKGDYPHFMLKEIEEIPSSLKSTYDIIRETKFKLPKLIDNVLFICCGTSYHSSLLGKKYIESISKIPAECEIASEFIYNDYLCKPNTLAVFISQSGETADTLSALNKAKEKGLFTLAITNVKGSTITRVADSVIYINVGAEICVASTKAYTSQVLTTLLLSNVLLNNKNANYPLADESSVLIDWNSTIDYLNLTEDDYEKLFSVDISSINSQLDGMIDNLIQIRDIHLIGKDYDYITSMEGSLKIKEVSYIFTDSYPCGELKHGTLSLIDNSSYVLSIVTQDGIMIDKSANAMHEITARGGKCIVISQFDENIFSHIVGYIRLPKLNKLLMPIISIVPIDLIAYRVSIGRGINPDKPRNLAKSVTVE